MSKHIFTSLAIAALLVPLAASAADPAVSVTGNVKTTQKFSLADLRGLKQTHVTVTQGSAHGPVPLDCSGVAVSVLLEKAQLNFGGAKNAALAHTLLFTADDNYAVALSMGEIDPELGHPAAVVATDCNGKPEDAPRLVVPGDKQASRALRGLVTIEVK